MSSCSCSWDGDGVGSMLKGPHVARAAVHGPRSKQAGEPFKCSICGGPVTPGQRCYDFSGCAVDYGWFCRMHEACFDLMDSFKVKVCGIHDICLPWPVAEAAEHAMAHGDDPFWRGWLLRYEQTWQFTEEER